LNNACKQKGKNNNKQDKKLFFHRFFI